MDIATAAARIDSAADLGATIVGSTIRVTRYGKPAGVVTQADLDQLGHTATGWGKGLSKGAYQVWQALQG